MSATSPADRSAGWQPGGDSQPGGRWHRWTAQSWAVALHEFRRLRHGRHALGRLLLISVPVVFALLVAAVLTGQADHAFSEPLVIHGERRAVGAELLQIARLFRFLNLPFVVFMATASLFANLYSSEIADRTLHHLFLLPVRREIITIGKYVAGVVVAFLTALVAWLLAMGILVSIHGAPAAISWALSLTGLKHVAAYATMLFLATAAYGALFLAIGALFRSPSLVAAAFWGWEQLTIFLPTGFKRFSIIQWVTSFMPMSVTTDSMFATLGDPEHPAVAVLVLAATVILCVAAATWRARHIQVSYGASE